MALDTPVKETGPIQVDAKKEGISFQEFLKRYDGQHAEWIMGKVEVHVSNNILHQMILLFLSNFLNTFLGFRPLGKLLLAGIKMYLGDDKPSREPDLMIVLNEHVDRIQPTYLDGPADIAIEIVSPESAERDYGTKFVEYERAGVAEYWRFDPIRKAIDIYFLTETEEDGTQVYHYHRAEREENGRITSQLLPGFAFDPTILWQEELPDGKKIFEMVQAMVSAEEAKS